MADTLEIGHIKDNSPLNTGATRRTYSKKKKKHNEDPKIEEIYNMHIANTKYSKEESTCTKC